MPDSEEVRGNLGQEQPVAGPSNSNGSSSSTPASESRPNNPARYVAPFFPHAAQPEISTSEHHCNAAKIVLSGALCAARLSLSDDHVLLLQYEQARRIYTI
jgi:hypothetical protein